MRRSAIILLVGFCSLSTVPASAQVDTSFLAGQSAQMGTSMYLADMVRRQSGGRPGGVVRGRPVPVRPVEASAASLNFRQSPAVRKQSVDRFLSIARRRDPAAAVRAQKVFAGEDVFGKLGSWMRGYGMSPTNVADCVAVYLSSAWMATRGTDADPSRAQMAGLRAQVTDSLRQTSGLARAPDAVKQDMADSNLIQAVIVSQLGAGAKADPSARERVADAVAKGARSTYGIDLRSVRLTNAGFVPG